MTLVINDTPNEGSTIAFAVTFYDDAEVLVAPSIVTWTLKDRAGSVVNSRSAVSVTPATTVNIVLSGDDLAFLGEGTRRLLVEATYDSTLGNGLALTEEIQFSVTDLVGVS